MRAAVLVVRGGEVALIRRRRAGAEYYLFPGGAVEPYESAIDAATREAREELGIDVRIDRVVATVCFNGRTQVYFAADEAGGTFGTGIGEELASDERSFYGSYEPCWMPVTAFEALDVRPRAVAHLLASAAAWPPSAPIDLVEAT